MTILYRYGKFVTLFQTTSTIIIEFILLVKCNLEKKGGRTLLSGEYSVEIHAKRTGTFLFKSRNMTGEITWIRKKKKLLEPIKMIFV